MKEFLLKVWWRNPVTRYLLPLAFFGVGIPLAATFENNSVVSNIGMTFIVIGMIGYFVAGAHWIHKSGEDVDKAMKEREEREKRERKRK